MFPAHLILLMRNPKKSFRIKAGGCSPSSPSVFTAAVIMTSPPSGMTGNQNDIRGLQSSNSAEEQRSLSTEP